MNLWHRPWPVCYSDRSHAGHTAESSPIGIHANGAKAAQAYQHTLPESMEENLRLLEIIAVSIHTFAGILYPSFHPETNIHPIMSDLDEIQPSFPPNQWFLNFYHTFYQHHYDRYPYGLLNVVGYWAETQILGGVLLFERGPSGIEVGFSESNVVTKKLIAFQNTSAFVHPQRYSNPYQLSNEQVERFAKLGRGSEPVPATDTGAVAFPFRCNSYSRFVSQEEQRELQIYKQKHDLPSLDPVMNWQYSGTEEVRRKMEAHGLPVPKLRYQEPSTDAELRMYQERLEWLEKHGMKRL